MPSPSLGSATREIAVAPTEGAERRAELILAIRTETGLDENVLERLVQEFYSVARQDPLLGPVFDKVKDWEAHIQKISTFWSSVALMTGRYHGQPMSAHLPLALEREHFERWLVLFEKTALLICTPTAVTLLMARANRIAQSLELGIAVNKGVIPAVKLTQADVRQPSPSQNNTKETSAYNAG